MERLKTVLGVPGVIVVVVVVVNDRLPDQMAFLGPQCGGVMFLRECFLD